MRGMGSAGVVLLSWVCWANAGQAGQTFRIQEHFGVAHPMQVIDFDLTSNVDPSQVHLVNESGQSVPFQILDDGKKIAVQTDLPAGASRRWQLVDGSAPESVKDGIQVATYQDQGRSLYQITNGLTGIRVPMPVQGPSPRYRPLADLFNYGPSYPRLFLPAPVQGILYRDGKWTAAGPNGVVFLANQLLRMDVRFLEKGPLKTVVQVSYLVEHPEYRYGQTRLAPAGRGEYRCTITVQAGQPSILFEEDTDLEMTWSINLYEGLQPTKGRYRGHHASKKEFGYEPDGQTYRLSHNRPPLDAEVDLFDKAAIPTYTPGPGRGRWLSAWDPWAFDTGYYWQLFNPNASAEANLVGVFAGRASLARGAGASGVSVLTMPASEKRRQPVAGLTVASYRRSASNQLFPRSHFHWGLFVGTKGTDLRPPTEIQPINRQMNLHGGFNLNKIHRYSPDFPDPPGGYGGLYMDRRAVETIKRKLTGPQGKAFHSYLYNTEPTARPLVDMWSDRSGAKRSSAIREVLKTATDMLNAYVNGGGIYSFHWGYWHGGLAMMRHGIWIDQILADPRSTAEERRQIKSAAVLFANVLWDNDFVPLDNDTGLNLGTANMPVQQTGYRDFYALLLSRHPTMAERAGRVRDHAHALVQRLVNEYGAEIGCPHYIGASFAPTLNTLLQLKQLGPEDPFRTEPRLAKFAEFYLNLQTPPEPRVGRKRAFISLGDSSTEPAELFGVLATAFRDADPTLSARLMGAWHANGKPHSGFFGTTLLMIDEDLPAADPKLGDANFPGYYSVLRHGWGTPAETAVWFVNGDHYSDHRHADHGSVIIYALGKPLSVDWGSLYTPHAGGAYLHSGVVLEKALGHAWDKDSPSLDAGGWWTHSTQTAFATFAEGAYARAQFQSGKTTWTRSVLSLRCDERHPILVLRDSFTGADANAPKVLTLNLMATGEVDTPAGRMNPTLRLHPAREYKGGAADQLPSTGRPFDLRSGVNRLGFRGKHDVDWDVYTVSEEPQQAVIGNWAVTPWGMHVTDKEERQHILRVRGTRTFTTVILSWRRGEKPDELSVRNEGDAVVVKTAEGTVRIEPNGYTCAGKRKSLSRRFANY